MSVMMPKPSEAILARRRAIVAALRADGRLSVADLARQVGLRFNHEYGEVFQIPEPVFCKETRGAENAVSYSAPNREMIRDILNLGGSEARICAQQTLERVKEAMGMNY